MNNTKTDFAKLAAAKYALNFISDAEIIGVGSGSTIGFFIKLLGNARMVNKYFVPTSIDTYLLLREYSLPVVDLAQVNRIDITIDGADSVIPDRNVAIKGGGGALLREKIVGYFSDEYVLIVDYTKIDRSFPIPLEVLPFAYSDVLLRRLKDFGEPRIRLARNKLGPIITDNGNFIIDLAVSIEDIDPHLEVKLNLIPGVLENGLFTRSARIIIGYSDGSISEEKIQGQSPH